LQQKAFADSFIKIWLDEKKRVTLLQLLYCDATLSLNQLLDKVGLLSINCLRPQMCVHIK